MPEEFINIHVEGVDRALFQLEGAKEKINLLLRDATHDIVEFHVREMARRAPHRTGNLARSAKFERPRFVVLGTARKWHAEAYTDLRQAPYAMFVEEGTGIFGPRRDRIYARPGNVLAFEVGGRRLYRSSVAGMRPHPYMEEAYVVTRDLYIPFRVRVLEEEIARL